ncbi:unnamed protein product [Lactuca virosa]|uniref:t-SNARE coiled-coil homology domain-containing protein n=1 Tax=Lactuca virosa TaxID=75947 RepID=A0AAU9MAR5_9ASTR|nr:unnamed protein product [Lactuca virosa]
MSLIDIVFRVDAICKKYEKYDIDKQRELNAYGDDAFASLLASLDSQIEAALRKSEKASMETNRATVVAMNAEIRRMKVRLMEEVPKLEKLAKKKVKGLSREELTARCDVVLALPERIREIPDGTSTTLLSNASTSATNKIKFDTVSVDRIFGDSYFQRSEESNQFRSEYEMRKIKQDEGLNVISEGLDTLKNLAHEMNEELDKQVPLMDEIEDKVDKVTSDIRNTNMKLRQTLLKVRSTRNFIIDIILLCIILGIASYLYNLLDD